MLYVPFAVGWLVAGTSPFRLLLLALSVTFVFIAREPLLVWWRGRTRGRWDQDAFKFSLGYLLLGAMFGVPLLVIYDLFWLTPITSLALLLLVLNGRQAVARKDRTIGGEMMAIVGLTITAPAAFYAARGTFDATALWLWALCAVYFASSVFYVKLRVSTINPHHDESGRQTRRCAFYHSFLLVLLLTLALNGDLNAFALIAFAPVLARSFWYLARPSGQINLRRVGLLEMVYSVVFLIFTTLNFHL
jgi:YwiC-like protein